MIDLTKKYALAVSGGKDSMVMLHYFANMPIVPNFFVVTVNHGIRTEAESDCLFVQDYCKKIGVECLIYRVDVPQYAKQNKLSEETAARELRYNVLEKVDADYVCLAHHASDNVETVLMHILRGSGACGAEGIKTYSGKYFRPILGWTRAEIDTYAVKNNVPFVVDSTNSNTKYKRNFIRKKIIPLLNQVNANAERNVLRFSQNIAEDDQYLNSLADISSVVFSQNGCKIPLDLLTQPKPIAVRVIYKVFKQLGVYKDIENSHVQALLKIAFSDGGKQVYLPFGYFAVNDYNTLSIEKFDKNSVDLQNFELPYAVGTTQTPFGTVVVSTEPIENALMFDGTKIPQKAVFRCKAEGDVITQFGGGTKTLKKYFIDKKIPQRIRSQKILIADGNKILVVCGVDISNDVKVEKDSQKLYIKVLEG